MYIMTKKRIKKHKRGTRKRLNLKKRVRRKFRRSLRKRGPLNLRFKTLRRGGASTLHKNAKAAKKKAVAAKKTANTKQAAHDKATKKAATSKTAADKKAKDANAAKAKAAAMKGKPGAQAARKAAGKKQQAAQKAKKTANIAKNQNQKTASDLKKAQKNAVKASAHAKLKSAVAKSQTRKKGKSVAADAAAAAKNKTRKKTAPTKSTPAFATGASVVLQGLKSRADLNGKQGVVRKYNAATGRFNVKLNIKPGTKKTGGQCKEPEDCESYRCNNSQCGPGTQSTEINVKPANLKSVSKKSPPVSQAPLPKPKEACNPFSVTTTACGVQLKKERMKQLRLCHSDQNTSATANPEFNTFQQNYEKQAAWCAAGGKGARPQKVGEAPLKIAQVKAAKAAAEDKKKKAATAATAAAEDKKKKAATAATAAAEDKKKKAATAATAAAEDKKKKAATAAGVPAAQHKAEQSAEKRAAQDAAAAQKAEKGAEAAQKAAETAQKAAETAQKAVQASTGDKNKAGATKKGEGESCSDPVDCITGICYADKCTTEELRAAAEKTKQEGPTTLALRPAPKEEEDTEKHLNVTLSPAAKEEVKKALAAPKDNLGQRTVFFKILLPEGSITQGSGGKSAAQQASVTKDAVTS